jgi:Formamidopyrimidine-DNA glycosylase N-terminal domain
MPELPEVETARRRAARILRGRRIARVAVVEDRIVYAGVRTCAFATAFSVRRVEAVGARASTSGWSGAPGPSSTSGLAKTVCGVLRDALPGLATPRLNS